MIANYHTHTPRCNHAVGAEEAYVRCALDAGLEILGFADHTPYPFPNGYDSGFRMQISELPDYVNSVLTLRQRYAGQIQIPLGVEAEYYPQYFPDMVSLLRDAGIEYMILGQHFLGNEIDDISPAYGGAEVVRRYCQQCADALYTGLFTYFAHPDIVRFDHRDPQQMQQIRRLCQAAKACRVPLEINLLGLQLSRHYPNPHFWALAAEEGCDVILGRDAHAPEALLDTETLQQGIAMANSLQLHLLQTTALRPL